MARVSHLSSISLTEPPGPGERRKLKGLRKLKVRMFSLVIPPPQIPVPLKVALELAPQAESSGSHGGGGNRRTGIGAPPPPPPPPPPMFGFPFHKRFLQEQPSMVSFPRITPKISLKMEGKKAITPVPQKRFFHDL